jgi:hypothetical protein
MTMFKQKKVFRLEKKKVRNEVNKNPISQEVWQNIVISGALSHFSHF